MVLVDGSICNQGLGVVLMDGSICNQGLGEVLVDGSISVTRAWVWCWLQKEPSTVL
jgi:hypothetical protein